MQQKDVKYFIGTKSVLVRPVLILAALGTRKNMLLFYLCSFGLLTPTLIVLFLFYSSCQMQI